MCDGCCNKECCEINDCDEPVGELIDGANAEWDEKYNKTYTEVYGEALEKLPEIEAVVDALCNLVEGNQATLKKMGGLLAEASGFIGIYVKEIVASAYEGRAEGLIASYDILVEKFGHDLALELIKKVA